MRIHFVCSSKLPRTGKRSLNDCNFNDKLVQFKPPSRSNNNSSDNDNDNSDNDNDNNYDNNNNNTSKPFMRDLMRAATSLTGRRLTSWLFVHNAEEELNSGLPGTNPDSDRVEDLNQGPPDLKFSALNHSARSGIMNFC